MMRIKMILILVLFQFLWIPDARTQVKAEEIQFKITEQSSEQKRKLKFKETGKIIKTDCSVQPCRYHAFFEASAEGLESLSLLVGPEREKVAIQDNGSFLVPVSVDRLDNEVEIEIVSVDKKGDISTWTLQGTIPALEKIEVQEKESKEVVVTAPVEKAEPRISQGLRTKKPPNFHYRPSLGLTRISYEQDFVNKFTQNTFRFKTFAEYEFNEEWSSYGHFQGDLIAMRVSSQDGGLRFFDLEAGAQYHTPVKIEEVLLSFRMGGMLGTSIGNQFFGYSQIAAPIGAVVLSRFLPNQDWMEASFKYAIFPSNIDGITRFDNQRFEVIGRYQLQAGDFEPAWGAEFSVTWLNVRSESLIFASTRQYYLGVTLQY
jgi:hypothetical protein